MNHYSTEEWQLFQEGGYTAARTDQMEIHLRECDDCRELFLSLITGEETAEAEVIISPGFTDSVLNAVADIAPLRNKAKRRKNRFLDFAVAAAVTLVFASGGFFQILVDTAPRVAEASSRVERPAVSLDWPGKMAGQAANWLHQLEFNDKGGMNDE